MKGDQVMGLFKTLGIPSKKEKKLKETGIAIDAVIVDVAVNNSVSINGRNPRKLICQGTIPGGEKRYFESGNVSAFTQPGVIGQPIKVYLDTTDNTKYYVDATNYK